MLVYLYQKLWIMLINVYKQNELFYFYQVLKMFTLNKLNVNDIRVNLILNEDYKSVVNFSSNKISSLNDFLTRLRSVVLQVIPILVQQQQEEDDIEYYVNTSLAFGNGYKELSNHATTLRNLRVNIDQVLNQLRFHTNEIDGGYFELTITNPSIHVDQHPYFHFYKVDSDYNSD